MLKVAFSFDFFTGFDLMLLGTCFYRMSSKENIKKLKYHNSAGLQILKYDVSCTGSEEVGHLGLELPEESLDARFPPGFPGCLALFSSVLGFML